MTTPANLQRWIDLSMEDSSNELQFLESLLDAELYFHVPLADASRPLRPVTFLRPDGLQVIPIFSSLERARSAARDAAWVGSTRGRDLFVDVPGATWILDPNDTTTTLYPERVRALLATGTACAAPCTWQGSPTEISAGLPEDRWLGGVLSSALEPVNPALAAHVLVRHRGGPADLTTLLIMVAVAPAHAERAARAVALALGECGRPIRLPVDLGTYDPAAPPEWTFAPRLEPVWRRSGAGDNGRN